MVDKENMIPPRLSVRTEAHNPDLQMKQSLMKQLDDLKYEIRTYRGTDPLEAYYNYVIWLEKNSKDDIVPVLEDILVKFKEIPAYKQDPRLVHILVEYISAQADPTDVYRIVNDQGLGTMCSLFYVRWAHELEKKNDFQTADQIFQLGIKRNAQPLNDLQNAHLQFQLKIARRVLEGGIDIVRRETYSTAQTSTAFGQHSTQIQNRDRKLSEIRQSGFEKIDEMKSRPSCVEMIDTGRRNKVAPKQSHPPHSQFPAESSRKVDRPSRKSEFKCPIAIFEPPDPLKKIHYPKHLVYVDGRDVQLEEIRAIERARREFMLPLAEPMNLTKSFNTRPSVTESLPPSLCTSKRDSDSNLPLDQSLCLRTEFIQPVEKPLIESKNSNASHEQLLCLKTDFIPPVEKPLTTEEKNNSNAARQQTPYLETEFIQPVAEQRASHPPNSDLSIRDQSWFLRTDFVEPAKMSQLSEPATSAQKFASESHSSTEPTFLKRKSEVQSSTQENERDKPQRPNEDDVFDFSYHVGKGNTSNLHHSPTASFTVNTRAAMNLIQRMWESPLAPRNMKVSRTVEEDDPFKMPVTRKSEYCFMTDEVDGVFPLATAEEERTNNAAQPTGIPAFAVYCEEDTNPQLSDIYARLSSRSSSHRGFAPVEDHLSTSMNLLEVGEEHKRQTNAPLMPRTVPLPNVPQQLENQDNDLGRHPVPIVDENEDMFDETCSTRAFQKFLPSSTPFSRPDRSRRGRVSSMFNGSYLDEDERPIRAGPPTMNGTKNPTNLSLILENSKEQGSSSGGMAPKSFS